MEIITDIDDMNMVLTDLLDTPVIAFELLPYYLKFVLSDCFKEVDFDCIEKSLVSLSARLTLGDLILLADISDYRRFSIDMDSMINHYFFIYGIMSALYYNETVDTRLFKRIGARAFMEHFKAHDYVSVEDISEDETLGDSYVDRFRRIASPPFVDRIDGSLDKMRDVYFEDLRRRFIPALAKAKKELIKDNTYSKAVAVMCGWR